MKVTKSSSVYYTYQLSKQKQSKAPTPMRSENRDSSLGSELGSRAHELRTLSKTPVA